MLRALLSVTLGGALGYAWYAFVGCSGGGCAVWANPFSSTLAGGFFVWAVAGGSSRPTTASESGPSS